MPPAIVYTEPVAVDVLRGIASQAAHCDHVVWTEGFAITLLQLLCIVFAVSLLVMFGKAATPLAPDHRKLYWPVVFGCLATALTYFAMSQDQGWFITHGCRQAFYVRYASLAFAMPMVVLSLGLLAEADKADIVATMGFSALMSVCLLCGSMSFDAVARWVWWGLSLVFTFLAAHQILYTFVPYLASGTSPVSRLSSLVTTCLVLYPFLWIFTQGFHIFAIWFEVFCGGAVDIGLFAVFGVLLMTAPVHAQYSGIEGGEGGGSGRASNRSGSQE